MIRVFVSGPYSGDTCEMLNNMRKGMRLCTELLLEGLAAFCCWTDYHFQLMLRKDEYLTPKDYYQYSMAWLEVSDVVLMMDRWKESNGATREHQRALELGKTIYYSKDDLIKATKGE